MRNRFSGISPSVRDVRISICVLSVILMVVGILVTLPGSAGAAGVQQQISVPADTGDWDATQPRGETREIDFATTEGTAMSVDVSPDGGWLVFDLMGHVYRLPMEGGEARSLTQSSGLAWNGHPSVSPDGEQIAFVSDRAGQRDLWIMDSDGSDPRPVTTDRDLEPSTPTWTPDGRYIVIRRDRISEDGPDDEGLWMVHRDGGSGVQLVGEEEVGGAYWPSVSPDGRYLFFHQISGGEPLNGDVQLRRYDLESGRVLDLTAGDNDGPASGRVGSGGAYAPETSPDGARVAFARELMDGTITHRGEEFGPRNSLWIRNLETGAERKVMDPISLRGGELRILPGYDWTPDGESIVIARGGKLRLLDVSAGEAEAIPFEARIQRAISEQAYNSFRIGDEPFQPEFLRWHTRSPDGEWLAFQAVGQVWVMEHPDGTPRRLTPESFDRTEYAPAWSPNGEWLAFTGMDASGRGHLYRARPDGGQPEQLTEREAFYTHPVWSPDGSEVLVTRGGGATARGRTVTHNAYFDLVSVPASGDDGTTVATVQPPSGTSPSSYARRAIVQASYGPDGRIYYPEPMELEGQDDAVMGMVSVQRDGSDRRIHMTFPYADEAVPSPLGDWVAFQEGDNAYVVPFPASGTGGDPVHVDKGGSTPLPVTQVSREGGLYVRWPGDSLLEYGSSNRHFTYRPDTGEKDTTRITFTVEKDRAGGVIALRRARIVLPHSGDVIEGGEVVAEDGRLRCVAPVGECDASDADRVVDASGKTVIPGLVDMHAHHYREHRGHRPRKDYEVAGYLAYGLTTTLDNSMWSENIFPTAERIEAGRMVGPRTYSTGDPPYQGDGANQNEIESYTVALDNVRRLKSWGAVSIKQYSHPRRDQRQWIIDAARREGLAVTGHWNPGVVMDGHTGWEHPLEWPVLQRDLTQLYGQADAVYSPTLIVGGPGPSNIDWFFQSSDVWKNDKQRDWMPWRMLTFLRERTKRPETDYSYPLIVQGVADIVEAGGHAAVGGHGEHHPLSPHWNIWMYSDVVGPMEALRIGTSEGAWFLGADEDVGSLEQGKLADLLVLNSNPLEEIRNTLDIQYVMKNGRLYEADSLDEVWPRQESFGDRYWIDPAALVDDARPVEPEN